MEELEQRVRATWEAGGYVALSHFIADVGERVVAAAGIQEGMRVLDVACGNGNATLPAARAGARAPGLDLAPSLLEAGRHVREIFADVATAFSFERHVTTLEWDSLDAFADLFMDKFPPMVMARQMLGDRFEELRAKTIAIWERRSRSADGRMSAPQECLLSVIRL